MKGVFKTLRNKEMASDALQECNVQAEFDGICGLGDN